MKHPYLCTLLTFIMCVSAYHSGVRLNAAELWNSTGGGVGSTSPSGYYIQKKKNNNVDSDALFNATKRFNHANRTQLFNSNDSSMVSSGEGGLQVAVHRYENVEMTRQKPSRQFKTMSAGAVANRQADIDYALQLEYNTRKATARNLIEVVRQDQIIQLKNEKERLARIIALKAAENAEKQAYEKDKARYVKNHKTRYKSGTSSSTQLKKPSRLFNDPNL